MNELGGWFLSSKDKVPSTDVRVHLEWLLAQFAGKRDALVWAREQGWDTVVSCYWGSAFGHGGPELSTRLTHQLVALDLDIWFDVYFIGDDVYGDDKTTAN